MPLNVSCARRLKLPTESRFPIPILALNSERSYFAKDASKKGSKPSKRLSGPGGTRRERISSWLGYWSKKRDSMRRSAG